MMDGSQFNQVLQSLQTMSNTIANAIDKASQLASDDMDNLVKTTKKTKVNHTKLPALSSGSAEDWYLWRDHFENVHLKAKWDARTARLRALGAMHGTARKMVRRIDLELPEDGSQPGPVKDLLDAYEEVFQPPLAREYLLEEFRAAVQREEETVVAFSARVADTFVRLYPDRADNADKDEQLYHVFKEGLRIPEVQNRVRDGEYKSLTDMVAAAQRAEVNVAKNIQKETGILPRNLAIEKAICAMSAKQGPSPAQFSGKCYICSASGHRAADCPVAVQVDKYRSQKSGGKSKRRDSSKQSSRKRPRDSPSRQEAGN